MRKNLFIPGLICLCASLHAQDKIDVLHYRYTIGLHDYDDHIDGSATITFVPLQNTSSVEFDLDVAEKRGMVVYKVQTPDSAKLSFNHSYDKLKIKGNFRKGDTSAVLVFYSGLPADGLIISRNRFGKRTFFSDNWPNRAHKWIPCVDKPAEKASFEFIVKAPEHYKVISNGVLISEEKINDTTKVTHWKESVALPSKVMVIGVADFAVDNVDTVSGVPVSSWVFRENQADGFHDYSIAPGILRFFMDYIGPYPYEKLANVQSKTMFGGMENAGAIFYAENSVNGRQDKESLIAHEIVHQWFGDMATEKSFAHLWLSEGFATYLTQLYLESKYGADTLKIEMKKDREKVIEFARYSRKPVVDSVSPYMELLNPNSYEKGGWILHMLRRQLGDSVFHACVRAYYARYAGKNADTRDLQQIFETVSGKDLSVFFHQWLYTAEIPELDISWRVLPGENQAEVTVTQKQKTLFSFPLGVAWGIGEPASFLSVTQRTEVFKMPFSTPPARLLPDPDASLLAIFHVRPV